MTINEIKQAILLCRLSTITSFLHGHKGLGKSSLHEQICNDAGWGYINMRCSQMEASDLRGLPAKENGMTVYCAPFEMPHGHKPDQKCPACDPKMTREQAKELGLTDPDYCQGLLFLDELNRAEDDVLQASFELVLDRKIGAYFLPKGWSIHCAGNFTDGYMVNNFSDPAFLNRFCHLQLACGESYIEGWSEYMNKYDSASKILQFVSFNPKHLTGEQKGGDMGFSIQPSPRSWEMVARVERACRETEFHANVKRAVIAGLIGQSLALQYESFTCEVTPRDIMDHGVDNVRKKLDGLTRNAVVGIVWGLAASAKQVQKTKKMMNNTIDFMEYLAKRTGGDLRDLSVSLGRSLCQTETEELAGAMLSNPQLAKLAQRWKDRNKKSGDSEFSWVGIINSRPDLQDLMSKVSYGQAV